MGASPKRRYRAAKPSGAIRQIAASRASYRRAYVLTHPSATDDQLDAACVRSAAAEADGSLHKRGGIKRSLLVDANGIPLALAVGPANQNDPLLLGQTLDALVIDRPDPADVVQNLCLDKGYDYDRSRDEAAERHYAAHIRARGEELQELRCDPLKRPRRWSVERTHAWVNDFRRLCIRGERKVINYEAFLHLACALLCLRAAKAG